MQIGERKGKSPDAVLVVNPSSGGGSTGRGWQEHYNQIIDTLGKNPKVVFTERSGDGTALTRHFLKNGAKRIIAVGGDGIVNEVANGFFVINREGSAEKRSPIIKRMQLQSGMFLSLPDLSHTPILYNR